MPRRFAPVLYVNDIIKKQLIRFGGKVPTLIPPYIRQRIHAALILPELGKMYKYDITPDKLILGNKLFIKVLENKDTIFSETKQSGYDTYYITNFEWGKGFDDYNGQQLLVTARKNTPSNANDDLIDIIHAAVPNLISRSQVERAVQNLTAREPVAYLQMKKKRREQPVYALRTVAERVRLCRMLAGEDAAELISTHQLGLVCYLLLTCFDRLGQLNRFIQFDDFLQGKKQRYKDLREEALRNAGDDAVSQSLALYRTYQKHFSVTNSFYRFIDEVLPEQERRALLECIKVFETPLLKKASSRKLDDIEVKRFLYSFRNRFTHQADYEPGLTIPLPREISNHPPGSSVFIMYDQWREEDKIITVSFRDFSETLFKCVKVGLVERLHSAASQT